MRLAMAFLCLLVAAPEPLQAVLEKLETVGLCTKSGTRWRLTPKGFMLSNRVILALLEAQQRSKPLAQRR